VVFLILLKTKNVDGVSSVLVSDYRPHLIFGSIMIIIYIIIINRYEKNKKIIG